MLTQPIPKPGCHAKPGCRAPSPSHFFSVDSFSNQSPNIYLVLARILEVIVSPDPFSVRPRCWEEACLTGPGTMSHVLVCDENPVS